MQYIQCSLHMYNFIILIHNILFCRRYSLLTYFRSTMIFGQPLITPMFYHYNHLTVNMSDTMEQFHIGDSILAAPVLLPRETHVIILFLRLSVLNLVSVFYHSVFFFQKEIYFPDSYYEIGGGQFIEEGWRFFPVVESDLPLFIKTGHILALQETTVSTEYSIY